MAKYLTDELELQNVANAIRAKGGTSESLAFPNGFVSAIEGIKTGGSSTVSAKDVNFRDYDGTIVAAYSATDFAALAAMPENPSHDGLTSQGWNWILADAKAYVAKYGRLEIGQMYITDDGKTRVYIHLEQGRTSPILGICPDGTVDVDWGDGTTHDTLTGSSTTTLKWTPTHNYAAPGDYVIKLTVSSGGQIGFCGENASFKFSGLLRFGSNSDSRNYAFRNAIRAVFCGSGVTSIGNSAFQLCYSLLSITIPSSITYIGTYSFESCYNLQSITIPSGLTSIGSNAFQYCYSLSSIMIPNTVTSLGYHTLHNCVGLVGITIPNSTNSISENLFDSCYNLPSITIPSGVTRIESYAFNLCCSLSSITIPSGVTSIGSYAFQSCYSIGEYHLTRTTPPTLSSTNAFSGYAADCIIYVPYSTDHSILNAYKSASNWSYYASKMQEEPQ